MMKLNQKSIFIVILVYFVEFQSAFQVLNGECPYIESIEDFDMKRFLGVWYIVQGSKPETVPTAAVGKDCIQLIFNEIDSESYISTQLPQNMSTQLKIPDSTKPSKLTLNMSGVLADFSILTTDYENFGAFMICGNLPDKKMQRAVGVLSRSVSLQSHHFTKIGDKLQQYSVHGEDLTDVFQCN